MDEAAVQAEILKGMQGDLPQQPQAPAGANLLDPTGAGGGNYRSRTSTSTWENKDLQVMDKDNNRLSNLKPLVNNPKLLNNFNNYLDAQIEQHQKLWNKQMILSHYCS